MALTKADIAEHLFTHLGMSKRDAKEMVEAFFEEIRQALEDGEQVKISGFGNFELRSKSERPGRNPKTGEDIPISVITSYSIHYTKLYETVTTYRQLA